MRPFTKAMWPSRSPFTWPQDCCGAAANSSNIFPTVKEVCSLTRAPMLSRNDLRTVLEALGSVLADQVFHPGTTAGQVCSRCLASTGLRVRQRDVAFLIKGLQLNGHLFGEGNDDVRTLGSRLVDQVLFLCAREQMVLDEAAVAAIRRWIVGDAAQIQVAASA
jgi:hypothetical protein